MGQPGPTRRVSALRVTAGVVVAVMGGWAMLSVVWPRLSQGDPVARQVAMASLPVSHDEAARCRTMFVASWHADVIDYYASTGCSGGARPTAVGVEVAASDGERHRHGCQGDEWAVLRCMGREMEGRIDCDGGCARTALTVTHDVHVPQAAAVAGTNQGACTVEGRELSCSYTVRQSTVTLESAWMHEEVTFLCETQATGRRRTRLADFAAPASEDVLVVTPAGPVLTAATQEAVRGVLTVAPGLPDLLAAEHSAQCTN